ncbi:MAG: hypothetical protein IID58_14210 [Proteobacteria bacterium]|nr:hypothetical protein [Pseudomonadota bacterium]
MASVPGECAYEMQLFLEVAEGMALVKLWETRGPPDFCKKIGGEWVCE